MMYFNFKLATVAGLLPVLFISLISPHTLLSQASNVNYDESKVPNYVLPELLVTNDGKKIQSKKDWEKTRRPELLELFASEMYGRTPREKIPVTYQLLKKNTAVFGGKATMEQILFTFTNGGKSTKAILLLFTPNHVKGKVPYLVGYNYKGNPSTLADTSIQYSPGLFYARPPEHGDWVRGVQSNRWPFEKIIERGYGVATMCYHDIFPDKANTKQHSIMPLFSDYVPGSSKPDEWQAIGAWAWGSSRILDYLQTRPSTDMKKIVLMGHSRQGKAALWAGAQDTRFSIVISNDSGEGGASLSRRNFGETLKIVSSIKPAWFAPAFNKYHDNEKNLPFDQHELVALVAPRPVYVASAQEDLWADPRGEFLSAYHAGPVYRLYGLKVIETDRMPEINTPVISSIGYHIRTGKHDVTDFDWTHFMNFADYHFKRLK